MTNKELLIGHINLLSEEDIASLLDAVILMETKYALTSKLDCPYCGIHDIIRYGHKCGKQRVLCKSCAKTFVPTTHAIMSNSHFPAGIWREVIKDTIHGNAIGYTVQRTGCSHQSVFDMRQKILMSLQQLPEISCVCFYNLNTVNGLHSFIKQRYVFYRGVASIYINRYNALFASDYRKC